jgi:hypothetical protein
MPRRTIITLAVIAIAGSAQGDFPDQGHQLPPLTDGDIQRVIIAHRAELKRCYTDALRRDPNLRGRVRMTLTIDTSGKVSRATDDGSDIPDMAVRTCVRDTLLKLVFPKSASATTAAVPFMFVPPEPEPDAGAPTDASVRG